MENEIWKDIIEFENAYQISSLGNIRSKERMVKSKGSSFSKRQAQKIIPTKMTNGYYKVSLKFNGNNVQKLIHRLVAIAFIPNLENKPQVNHIDGNKKNNCLSNLEWNTAKENLIHAAKNGLSNSVFSRKILSAIPIIQKTVNGVFIKKWESLSKIQTELGYSKANIHKRINSQKKNNKAYGFIWEYE